MSAQARVLNGLMERRALESAFQALSDTRNVDEQQASARRIAEHGAAAIPVLISLLDTTDPQLRGGLGQVAAQLDRDEVAGALRSVARGSGRSDNARLTALMILERYLHEPVDDSLLAGLQDPDAVAVQSLRELSHEMARKPAVVIEYLNQLAEQPPEVALTVLDAFAQVGLNEHMIALLRMFAQSGNPSLARRAIDQLTRARSPEAARALSTLSATLPPELAAQAARGLRKLQMLGVQPPAAGDRADWRALLSPVDGAGAQVAWFIRRPANGAPGTLFSVLMREPAGIIGSFGSGEVPAEDLPPDRPIGTEYIIEQAAGIPPIAMLEVPLDAGRQAVREALEMGWERGALPPAEYRLYNDTIWSLGPLEPLAEPAPVEASPDETAALLDHPAFGSWFWQSAAIYEAAGQLDGRQTLSDRAATISGLLETYFDAATVDSYRRRLRGMARWLALVAPDVAGQARAAAGHFDSLPAAQVPFFRRLVGIGLDVAAANLRSGFDWRRHLDQVA